MKKLFITILTLTCAATISAQQAYTLQQCKELALENNARSKNAQLNIQGAQQFKKEAFTSYFPTAGISGMGFKAKDPILTMPMGETPLELLEDGLMGVVTISQPVFTGGKILYGNKLAGLGVDVSRQQSRLTHNELALRTEQLYWQLVSLYEKQKTLDILENQLNELLKEVQISYGAGLITRNDVLQVQLKLNDLKSKRVNLGNSLNLAKMALCQHTGIPIDSYEQFEISKPNVDEVDSPVTLYINHRNAMENRAENRLLENNVQESKLQTRLKRAEYLPKVAVGASYYKQDLMEHWDGNGLLFVSVTVPLSGWWGGTHALKKQKINEQITQNNKTDGQEQLLLQMQQVRNELDDAWKQIAIARESIDQAAENLRLNKDYYKVGTVTLTDLLDAQSFLQQNRDKYVEAYSFYQQKRFEYLVVTGR